MYISKHVPENFCVSSLHRHILTPIFIHADKYKFNVVANIWTTFIFHSFLSNEAFSFIFCYVMLLRKRKMQIILKCLLNKIKLYKLWSREKHLKRLCNDSRSYSRQKWVISNLFWTEKKQNKNYGKGSPLTLKWFRRN